VAMSSGFFSGFQMISILKEELIDVQFSPVFYAVLMASSGIIFALILGLRVLVILFLGGMRSTAGEDESRAPKLRLNQRRAHVKKYTGMLVGIPPWERIGGPLASASLIPKRTLIAK